MKLSRVLFVIPSITFIVIGLSHTYVHLTDLSGPAVQSGLRAIGSVAAGAGQVAEMQDLWNGLSLLMGFFSMALGATNLASLRATDSNAAPPLGVTLVSITMLVAVTTVGALYLGPIQMVGGPIGITCFIASIIAGKRSVTNT